MYLKKDKTNSHNNFIIIEIFYWEKNKKSSLMYLYQKKVKFWGKSAKCISKLITCHINLMARELIYN